MRKGASSRSDPGTLFHWLYFALTAVSADSYDCGMTTTIELNAELARQVAQLAAREGRPLTAVVEEAVTHLLSACRRANGNVTPPVSYPPYGGGGAVPGLDLSDNSVVRDFLDEGIPPEKLR
jgi:hypothetical protein